MLNRDLEYVFKVINVCKTDLFIRFFKIRLADVCVCKKINKKLSYAKPSKNVDNKLIYANNVLTMLKTC